VSLLPYLVHTSEGNCFKLKKLQKRLITIAFFILKSPFFVQGVNTFLVLISAGLRKWFIKASGHHLLRNGNLTASQGEAAKFNKKSASLEILALLFDKCMSVSIDQSGIVMWKIIT